MRQIPGALNSNDCSCWNESRIFSYRARRNPRYPLFERLWLGSMRLAFDSNGCIQDDSIRQKMAVFGKMV